MERLFQKKKESKETKLPDHMSTKSTTEQMAFFLKPIYTLYINGGLLVLPYIQNCRKSSFYLTTIIFVHLQ